MEGVSFPKTVLCREPDKLQQKLFRCAMEDAKVSFEVQYVESLEELFSYLKGQGKYQNRNQYPVPSLIITEHDLDNIVGTEFIPSIHAINSQNPAPIIVFSSISIPYIIENLYQQGITYYIQKPYHYDELIQIIQYIARTWLNTIPLQGNI